MVGLGLVDDSVKRDSKDSNSSLFPEDLGWRRLSEKSVSFQDENSSSNASNPSRNEKRLSDASDRRVSKQDKEVCHENCS